MAPPSRPRLCPPPSRRQRWRHRGVHRVERVVDHLLQQRARLHGCGAPPASSPRSSSAPHDVAPSWSIVSTKKVSVSVAASAPASPTPSARWSRCRTPSRSTVARRPAAAPRRRARACAAPAPRLGKLGGRPRWISRRSSSWGLPGERRAEDHQEIRQGRSGVGPPTFIVLTTHG